MKIKLFKRLMCFVISFMLLAVCAVPNQAAQYKLKITRKEQEKDNWCWAACAQMLGNYYGNTLSQSNICQYIKGSIVDQTADYIDTTNAFRYAISNVSSKKNITYWSAVSFYKFVNTIKLGDPAVLRMKWSNGKGHVVIVGGVQEEEGPAYSALYLIDVINKPNEQDMMKRSIFIMYMF